MDNNIDAILNSSKQINKIYEKVTYFDEYGGSVLLFILITILLFVAHSYSVVMLNIKPLKENWPAERCKPSVIPFAGLINPPSGMSVNDYTAENFNYCMQNILISISGYALEPITYVTSLLTDTFNELGQAMNLLNSLMASVRTNIGDMTKNTMTRISNVLIPIQKVIIAVRDFMGKTKGIMTGVLYTSLGTYYALQSFLGAVGQLLILVLCVMVGLILAFWVFPFTWPFAISMTAIFISISIPLAIMLIFLSDVLNVQIDSPIPPVPSNPNTCFDKDTYLEMNNGTFKKIKDIELGDILYNNNVVTAKFLLDAKQSVMYQFDNLIVSGSHIVKYYNFWIPVSMHPRFIKIENYSERLIYCINTSQKIIQINDFTFADWDEIYEEEHFSRMKEILTQRLQEEKENLGPTSNSLREQIHVYLDGGLSPETKIPMFDVKSEKREKRIDEICVGDILCGGERVYGIVEIDGTQLFKQEYYPLGVNDSIEGGPNLILNIDNKHFSTLEWEKMGANQEKEYLSKSIKKKTKLYHLLTNTGSFYVGNIKVFDYNSILESEVLKIRADSKSE